MAFFTGGNNYSWVVAEIFSPVMSSFLGRSTNIFSGRKKQLLALSRFSKIHPNFKQYFILKNLEVNRKMRLQSQLLKSKKFVKSIPWHFFVTRDNFWTFNPLKIFRNPLQFSKSKCHGLLFLSREKKKQWIKAAQNYEITDSVRTKMTQMAAGYKITEEAPRRMPSFSFFLTPSGSFIILCHL